MINFVKSGDNLTLVAPYDVLSGGGFKVGNLFGCGRQRCALGRQRRVRGGGRLRPCQRRQHLCAGRSGPTETTLQRR